MWTACAVTRMVPQARLAGTASGAHSGGPGENVLVGVRTFLHTAIPCLEPLPEAFPHAPQALQL
jgi:hypothetical protein